MLWGLGKDWNKYYRQCDRAHHIFAAVLFSSRITATKNSRHEIFSNRTTSTSHCYNITPELDVALKWRRYLLSSSTIPIEYFVCTGLSYWLRIYSGDIDWLFRIVCYLQSLPFFLCLNISRPLSTDLIIPAGTSLRALRYFVYVFSIFPTYLLLFNTSFLCLFLLFLPVTDSTR